MGCLMLDNERQQFAKTISYMFSLYPNTPVSEAQLDAYWYHLRKFPLSVTRFAVQEASKQSKKYPPTAPAIHEIAEVEERAAAERAKHPRPSNAPQLPRASWEGVPRTDHGQQEYIKASSGYERLARIWECEAVRAGVKPNEPPPAELGAKWFKQLGQMLEQAPPGSITGRYVQDESGKWSRDGGQTQESA